MQGYIESSERLQGFSPDWPDNPGSCLGLAWHALSGPNVRAHCVANKQSFGVFISDINPQCLPPQTCPAIKSNASFVGLKGTSFAQSVRGTFLSRLALSRLAWDLVLSRPGRAEARIHQLNSVGIDVVNGSVGLCC